MESDQRTRPSNLSSGKVISSFKGLMDNLDGLIKELKELDSEMRNFKIKCDVAKGAGTTLNTIGAGAAVVGLFLTGPVGLLVAGGIAIGTTVGGTATNIITTKVDEDKTKDCLKKIEELIKSFEIDIAKFRVIANFLAEQVFIYADEAKCSFEAALAVIFGLNNNIAEAKGKLHDKKELSGLEKIVAGKYGLLKSFLIAMVESGGSNRVSAVVVGKVCNLFVQDANFTITALELGGKFFKRTLVVANVVLQTVEVVSTIVDIVKNHATCEEIGRILDKLNGIKKQYVIILSEMEDARECGRGILLTSNIRF